MGALGRGPIVSCKDCDVVHQGPCDPEQLKEHQAWEARIMERQLRAEQAAREMVERLRAKGIPAQLGWDCRYKVEISGLDLIDKEREP
jgi:hypothetical protein